MGWAFDPGSAIEIRWGNGNPPTNAASGASGIEDDIAGVAVPATRFPFGNETNGGVAASFTSNQCRRIFIVTANDYYTEWPWT